MKSRLIVRMSLLILIMVVIVQAGCQSETPTVTDVPTGGPTATSTDTPPTEVTPTDTPTEVATEVPTETAPTEVPATLIDPVLKPSLVITGLEGTPAGPDSNYDHTIGFTFPDGLVAIKAAAIFVPIPEDNLTVVGVVEVGPEAEKIGSGVYTLALDLRNPDAEAVNGRLTPQGGGGTPRDLTFERVPMERNPARADDPLFPTIVPSITSDATCFTIAFVRGIVAQDSQVAQTWSSFCSQSSTDTGDLILSVRDNYPSKYEELSNGLRTSLTHVLEFLSANGYPQNEIRPDYNQIISEIESEQNIIACSNDQDCRSDLTGAPNVLFWDQYNKAKSDAAGNNFAVTIALAKIERPMDFPDQIIIQPGDYLVRLWFNPEDTFLGATLLGVTVTDELVPGQSIPAIPAYLLDPANPQKIESRISAWGMGSWCMWPQRRC